MPHNQNNRVWWIFVSILAILIVGVVAIGMNNDHQDAATTRLLPLGAATVAHSSNPTIATAPTTTMEPIINSSYKELPSSKIEIRHYCSGQDLFCTDLPYLADPNFGSLMPPFRVGMVPASDGSSAFMAYETTLARSPDGDFCPDTSNCYARLSEKKLISRDEYQVFVFADTNPSQPLNQFDSDCVGRDQRVTRPVVYGPESGLEVTCRLGASTDHGSRHIIFVRHGGKIYEITASNFKHDPVFAEQFLASVSFTS